MPDHRVQDINGASFAGPSLLTIISALQHLTPHFILSIGFYYVCVDFNPQPVPPSSRPVVHPLPHSPEHEDVDAVPNLFLSDV